MVYDTDDEDEYDKRYERELLEKINSQDGSKITVKTTDATIYVTPDGVDIDPSKKNDDHPSGIASKALEKIIVSDLKKNSKEKIE